MSLHIIDVEQGTEEWHDARRGIVTASVVGQLITPSTLKPADNDISRGLTRLLVAERISGYTEPTYQNGDMFRGVIEEPRARDAYSEHYAPATEVGFMIRDDWGASLGYSPDGVVGDDGLIEIKAPRMKEHVRTILADEVPDRYMAQLQAGLLVSGRDWIDYVSWCGGLPMWVRRVLPDERWHEAILTALDAFEMNAAVMVGTYRRVTSGLPVTERIDYSEVELKL